ncbi:MAG: amidophosphoribosyltransferase [Planctomycetes bacterium]|nr:amidophosphoribosyltransferase [Planctomycetota bacterium]
MQELHHECGIAAIYHLESPTPSNLASKDGPEQISKLMVRMLIDLQNRGQLATGMTSFNPHREKVLDTYKQIGTVIEAFRLNHPAKFSTIMRDYAGRAAIGHVRYATCGKNDRDHAQPFERYHGRKWKWFTMAFNGQITNYPELKSELLNKEDYYLMRDLDTEVIMHYLSYELRGDDRPDLVEVFSNLSKKFDGAYNLVFMNGNGDMAVVRDPVGIRPLCYATDGPLFAAASESVALSNIGFRDIKTLQPGEMVLIQDREGESPAELDSAHGTAGASPPRRKELRVVRYAPARRSAHCFFEWIYFANVASTLDDRSVYLSRAALGKELAIQEHRLGIIKPDYNTVVVPVPDTGKAAADAMAYELGVPSVEGLMRNRHIGRTFIEGNNRADRVKMKFSPLREVLEGRRVILVEDSIVRSTTLKSLLSLIRDRGGAKEIHVRVACPPIIAPCFYGIDMSTVAELYAPRHMRGKIITIEEQQAMARELEADSLFYLPLDAIARCIRLPVDRLCRACITGEYPTPAGERMYQLALRQHEEGGGNGRTYESGSRNGCG